jgi:hypothetical protein
VEEIHQTFRVKNAPVIFLEKSQSWSNRLRFQIIPQLYKPVDYGKVVDDTDKLVMLPYFLKILI